ncbi:MAG: hypothetical protein A2992_06840 [Elusimicrobia bacterium RIFCSPLOWO2_01_FULL_59_12]|nr:MAG: hypothetical protein A2992_06840 [Elusimicrobia bacterium RIFCSPLOWO2_01_FULL_59_12]
MATVIEPLIQALQNPAIYDHPVAEFKVVETHISWVILTGPVAYKIKKPVDLGFLDFTTLEKRRTYCEEEIRINRRLCPDLYLDVVPITGRPGHPELGGRGTPFEYAVKMRQFDEDLLWDRMVLRNEITPAQLEHLAAIVAEFHRKASRATPPQSWGTPETIWTGIELTLGKLVPHLVRSEDRALYGRVVDWNRQEFKLMALRMLQRLREGFVREGHGDLHLRNIALFSRDKPDILVFDGIEFDDTLRWIDVINDVAFLMMDLNHRGRSDLGWRFLNSYLEITGDYKGLDLLRFYAANRALVRAEVLAILSGPGLPPASREFLTAAEAYTHSPTPCLYITHGLSGSGKTTLTKEFAIQKSAIRIRSDIERKRLYGLAPEASSSEALKTVMYGPEGNLRTYGHLKDLTGHLLKARWNVIVDATFLKRESRGRFQELAYDCDADFAILDFRADEETLRRRIRQRIREQQDASEADLQVVDDQIRTHQDITNEEKPFVIAVDTEAAQQPK